MGHVSLRRLGATLATSIVGLALIAPGAGAEVSSVYAPTQEARDFAAGSGGWVESSRTDSCVVAVSCPTVSNSHEPAGGVGGDGHLRSGFSTLINALGSATAVWQSPQFTYVGADGAAPDSISFAMARRADVGDLLGTGSTATYAVDLIDVSGGGIVTPVIAATPLDGAATWTAVGPVAIDPGQMTLGSDYAIRVSSTYSPGVLSVLVSGSADYDNVALTASRVEVTSEPGGDSPSGGGGDGADGGDGAAGNSSISHSVNLRALFRGRATGPARLRGKRLFVKVSCPRRVGRACRITAQGLLGKGRPATARRTVKVGKGKGRRIALRVRPRLRARVAKRKRLLVRERVRAGRARTTIYKRRKLIRR